MADTVLDRGGSVGLDPVAAPQPDTVVARSGGWGNVALLGAGIGLISAIGGIAIGYGAFHQPATAAAAASPAKASDRVVEDAMANPSAQRAALANQLGQPGAAPTDIFGRPLPPASAQSTGTVGDTDLASAGNTGTTPTAGMNGQRTPAEVRAEQARVMADAARRSPIMAFANSGSAATTSGSLAGADGSQPGDGQHDEPGGADRRLAGPPSALRRGVGASGFGPPGDSGAASAAGPDFADQLAHAAIQTVRATRVADRSLLLSAGTVIPCTLQIAINSTQAGFVSCVINHDVYSEDGRIILLDKGTKVLGQYSGGITQGQARLFVLWSRALTPRGVAIDLGSPAADSLGRAGLPGGVDTQFWSRFGLGLVISVLEDASGIAGRAVAGEGSYTTQVPGTTANTILQQTMQVGPILKKNQGDSAAIFVAKDFDFRPVYDVRLRR